MVLQQAIEQRRKLLTQNDVNSSTDSDFSS